MGFLNERDRQTLAEMFRDLKFPVHVDCFWIPTKSGVSIRTGFSVKWSV